jgi:hypothetical protein
MTPSIVYVNARPFSLWRHHYIAGNENLSVGGNRLRWHTTRKFIIAP